MPTYRPDCLSIGRYAYITNIYDNTVSVIDIEKKSVVVTVSSGNSPNGISFSPLPAIPATSATLQLELPESEMPEMPH